LDQFNWWIFHLFAITHWINIAENICTFAPNSSLVVDTNCILHFCAVRNQDQTAGMPWMRLCSTSASWRCTSTSRRKEAMTRLFAAALVVLVWHSRRLVHRHRLRPRQPCRY
jgi:hypothetical protein